MGLLKDKPVTRKEATKMECQRCGVCCRKHQALVTPRETSRIVKYLGITLDDWEKHYDDPRWRHAEYRLIRHVNGACVFLMFDKGLATCRIHAVKPACCVKWQAGPDKKECREGMGKKNKSRENKDISHF